jgi:hypothetical protein
MPKYFINRCCLFKDEPIVFILTGLLPISSGLLDGLKGTTSINQNPYREARPLGRKSLYSVLSLRSFYREFTRFEKKHYPWSDLTNKNTPATELLKMLKIGPKRKTK